MDFLDIEGMVIVLKDPSLHYSMTPMVIAEMSTQETLSRRELACEQK
jgi:hypothetical protein